MTMSVKIEPFKERLLALEKEMTARADRAMVAGCGEFMDVAHDSGDASVANEVASEKFTEAELDSVVLLQIREALARMNDGTFQCGRNGSM